MALPNGALILHLGSLDESFVHNRDCYLCIRSVNSNVTSAIYVCWRANPLNESDLHPEISYRELDSDKDLITPLHIEMLAGEELPHLLQTLLVGVEHAICRIPLDEITFPSTVAKFHHSSNVETDDDKKASKRATTECNLKRSELITKNNSINKKKYAVKRISQSGSICDNIESETVDDETIVNEREEFVCSDDKSVSEFVSESSSAFPPSSPITTSTLPLFCLGGSFPHIDSDEESGDDAKKIQSGELCIKIVITL